MKTEPTPSRVAVEEDGRIGLLPALSDNAMNSYLAQTKSLQSRVTNEQPAEDLRGALTRRYGQLVSQHDVIGSGISPAKVRVTAASAFVFPSGALPHS